MVLFEEHVFFANHGAAFENGNVVVFRKVAHVRELPRKRVAYRCGLFLPLRQLQVSDSALIGAI